MINTCGVSTRVTVATLSIVIHGSMCRRITKVDEQLGAGPPRQLQSSLQSTKNDVSRCLRLRSPAPSAFLPGRQDISLSGKGRSMAKSKLLCVVRIDHLPNVGSMHKAQSACTHPVRGWVVI